MTSEDLRIEDDPRQEDIALLDARLYEFNAAASGVHDGRSLAVFVREADGAIVAGPHRGSWGGGRVWRAPSGPEGLPRGGLGQHSPPPARGGGGPPAPPPKPPQPA